MALAVDNIAGQLVWCGGVVGGGISVQVTKNEYMPNKKEFPPYGVPSNFQS
jgi:hypothetical protein